MRQIRLAGGSVTFRPLHFFSARQPAAAWSSVRRACGQSGTDKVSPTPEIPRPDPRRSGAAFHSWRTPSSKPALSATAHLGIHSSLLDVVLDDEPQSRAELAGRSSQSSTRVASHEFDRPAVAGRSILPSARERERRSGLELILRHVEDPMVRIGARAFRASVRKRAALALKGPASGSGRRWGRAGYGRCYGPIHPADLAIGNRHVVLAQAKEATHPDHNQGNESRLTKSRSG
jgi:hypothetical protein